MSDSEINTNAIPCTYINVETSEGMFSTECAVIIELINGDKISLFADKELLIEKNGQWLLKVTEVKKNSNSQIILLPVEAFETSTRWAEVAL